MQKMLPPQKAITEQKKGSLHYLENITIHKLKRQKEHKRRF